MDIIFQYYNEVVLSFNDYEVEYIDKVIIVHTPAGKKPFDIVCKKIFNQLTKIADTLDTRDKDVKIQVRCADQVFDILLEKQTL
jgi:hypothetical protein